MNSFVDIKCVENWRTDFAKHVCGKDKETSFCFLQFPPLFAAGPSVEGHLLTTWFFLHLLEVRGEDIASGNIKLRGEQMLLVRVFFVSLYFPILKQIISMTKTANYVFMHYKSIIYIATRWN